LAPIGLPVNAETGVVASALQTVEEVWTGKSVTVFLYNSTNGKTGNKLTYIVSGFAQFEITQVDPKGGTKSIQGRFIDYVQLGGTIDPKITTGNMGVALVIVSNTPIPAPTATATRRGDDDDDDDHEHGTSTPEPTATRRGGDDDDDHEHGTSTPEPTATKTPVPTATNTPVPTPTPECDEHDNRDGNKCKKEN